MRARLQFFRAAPYPRLRVPLPLMSTAVCAGFPSPADDHLEGEFDLNELLIRNPPVRVRAVYLLIESFDQRDGILAARAAPSEKFQQVHPAFSLLAFSYPGMP